ncbi:hypothetical protein [Roseomonas sp. WA12]
MNTLRNARIRHGDHGRHMLLAALLVRPALAHEGHHYPAPAAASPAGEASFLAQHGDGQGALEPLANFMTNPAGAAIVNAMGPIRQVVQGAADLPRRYLVIVPGDAGQPGAPVQDQQP